MSDLPPEALAKRFRLILNLGRYRVSERFGNTIKIALGGTTTVTVTNAALARSDIAAGDILTIYTEIPYSNPGGHV